MKKYIMLMCVTALFRGFSDTVGIVPQGRTILPASEIAKLNSCELTKFNTKQLPGAHGLDVDVYYPSCMKFEQGGFQAHTVGKASYGWNDNEIFVQIMVSVFDVGKECVDQIKLDYDGHSEAGGMKDLVPKGASFIDGGIVKIRETKVRWVEFEMTVERMGESRQGAYRFYQILADSGYIFNLQFSVGGLAGKSPRADFIALKPMMKACAVALTLRDYSQFNSSAAKIASAAARPQADDSKMQVNAFFSPTMLPHHVLDELLRSKLTHVNLSRVKFLECPLLDVTIGFPSDFFVENASKGEMTFKVSKAWRKYGAQVFMSVDVHDVGVKYVRDLRESIKYMTKAKVKSLGAKNLAESLCIVNLEATFIDGGFVDDGGKAYSWIDFSLQNKQGGGACSRMLTVPAMDGKFITISCCVLTNERNIPLNDFNYLKPLFNEVANSIKLPNNVDAAESKLSVDQNKYENQSDEKEDSVATMRIEARVAGRTVPAVFHIGSHPNFKGSVIKVSKGDVIGPFSVVFEDGYERYAGEFKTIEVNWRGEKTFLFSLSDAKEPAACRISAYLNGKRADGAMITCPDGQVLRLPIVYKKLTRGHNLGPFKVSFRDKTGCYDTTFSPLIVDWEGCGQIKLELTKTFEEDVKCSICENGVEAHTIWCDREVWSHCTHCNTYSYNGIQSKHQVLCTRCKGKRYFVKNSKLYECSACEKKGFCPCPYCKGSGTIRDVCSLCNGKGRRVEAGKCSACGGAAIVRRKIEKKNEKISVEAVTIKGDRIVKKLEVPISKDEKEDGRARDDFDALLLDLDKDDRK